METAHTRSNARLPRERRPQPRDYPPRVDHIGGLSDFPDAHIHVTVAEASARSGRRPGARRSVQSAHGPMAQQRRTPSARARSGWFRRRPRSCGDIARHRARFHCRSHRGHTLWRSTQATVGAAPATRYINTRNPRRPLSVPRALTAREALVASIEKRAEQPRSTCELYRARNPICSASAPHDPKISTGAGDCLIKGLTPPTRPADVLTPSQDAVGLPALRTATGRMNDGT